MLYPQTNQFRSAISLDGIWKFKKDSNDSGLSEDWAKSTPEGLISMPVPAAFNEMTEDAELKDYFGVVWYFTGVPFMKHDGAQRIRFGAAVYHADIFLNGEKIASEHLGKLPFEVDVSGKLNPEKNILAVRIDTRLTWETLPPGTEKTMVASWSVPNKHGNSNPRPEYHFDFLNYGGILRSVLLLNLPAKPIECITVKTLIKDGLAIGLEPIVDAYGQETEYALKDADGKVVATGDALIPETPIHWSTENPYLYTLEVSVAGKDIYRLPVGLRTVRVSKDAILINEKPVYFKGCGLHEDFHLIGHGHSDTRLCKDLTMLKDMGANSFRTAHYPYDERAYQLADELGLLVINETPAVGLNAWDSYTVFDPARCHTKTLEHHKRVIKRMIERDSHHACVIMWSLANEPSCYEPHADAYFKELFEYARSQDPENMPMTVVQSSTPPGEFYESHHSNSAKYSDVICWNRYYAWYQDGGHPEDVGVQAEYEANAWRTAFPDKPLMLSEFGADALAGEHATPPVMFSEEYQTLIIQNYCEQLDKIPYVIGEHVWNFADFMTKQGLTRAIGNRKGIHTRERMPKQSAHYLKQRWLSKVD